MCAHRPDCGHMETARGRLLLLWGHCNSLWGTRPAALAAPTWRGPACISHEKALALWGGVLSAQLCSYEWSCSRDVDLTAVFIKQPHTKHRVRFCLLPPVPLPARFPGRLTRSPPVPCACHTPSHFPAHPFSPLQPPPPPRSPRWPPQCPAGPGSRPQHGHLRRRLSWDSLCLADRSEPRLGSASWPHHPWPRLQEGEWGPRHLYRLGGGSPLPFVL